MGKCFFSKILSIGLAASALIFASAPAQSATLAETAAAAAIATTIQGQQAPSGSQALQAAKQAKDTLQARQEAIQSQLDINEGNNPGEEHGEAAIQSQLVINEGNPKNAARGPASQLAPDSPDGAVSQADEEDSEDDDQAMEEEEENSKNARINYKREVHVFYKPCALKESKDCHQTPVFTNIKSVVFNYGEKRGIFAENAGARTPAQASRQ